MNKIYQLRSIRIFAAIFSIAFLVSCGDDEDGGGGTPTDDPIASFQFEIDGTNIFQVTFTNFSQNATSYSWDFGDGNTSTEENPVHTYAATGSYNVTLTAVNGPGATSMQTKTVNVTDPFEELRKLTGDVSKTWRLLRDVSTGDFPIGVFSDAGDIWWAFGNVDNNLGDRPCWLDDNYTFFLDGTFQFEDNGDTWADAGVWNESAGAPGCTDSSDPANMINVDGADISAWGSGTFTFDFDPTAGTLTTLGTGAHIGLAKAATDAEVIVPQPSVTYTVVKLTEGDVDTLIVQTTIPGGVWKSVLVHYDDPTQEPPLPGPPPVAGFTSDVNGFMVSFTNTSTGADSFSWDFGDGNSSTDMNPTHTYASCGTFTVTLTATNANGNNAASESISVGADPTDPTAADLHGGSSRTWKLISGDGAFRVGNEGPGSGNFFSSGQAEIDGRPCLFDDEFILKSDGSFEFASQGALFGEPYMGVDPAGCVDEVNLTPPYDGFASNAGYSFTLTPGAPTTITVNGSGAFLGFNKGFNGGEYTGADGALQTSITYEVVSFVDCGNEQILDIAVDIAGDGLTYWSMTLVASE